MSQLVNLAPGFQYGQARHDNTGIMDSQRALAEITEMVHAAHQIHHSLLDVSGRDQSPRGDVGLSDISKRLLMSDSPPPPPPVSVTRAPEGRQAQEK